MRKTGGIVGVKADDIGKSPGVDADRLCLRREVTRRQVGEVLYRVVIVRNQDIAVIRDNGAIAEIADNDTSVVDTKQLIEVRVTWIIEHKEGLGIGSICSARWANATGGRAMSATVVNRRRAMRVESFDFMIVPPSLHLSAFPHSRGNSEP